MGGFQCRGLLSVPKNGPQGLECSSRSSQTFWEIHGLLRVHPSYVSLLVPLMVLITICHLVFIQV